MGFDVLYYPVIDDSRIVRLAREQDRIVLTRDTGLIRRKGLKAPVYIVSEDLGGQLDQMMRHLDFGSAAPGGRCMACNGLLRKVSRSGEVRINVPDYVFHSVSSYLQCEACGKYYWEGTHAGRFREYLDRHMKARVEN